MARCGLQSPHLVSPHCFIAVGILNIICIYRRDDFVTRRMHVPGAHQLVKGLEWIVDGEAVGEPSHDPGVGPLVHLGGQEEGVAPEADFHGVLQALGLVTVQEVTPELVHRGLWVLVIDEGSGRGHVRLVVRVIVYAAPAHTLVIPVTAGSGSLRQGGTTVQGLPVPEEQLSQVAALHLTLLPEKEHQHLPEQDVALLVGDVPPPRNARYLPLAELDHVVLVSLAGLERAGEGGELLALPVVPQQRGDAVNLDSGGLTILESKHEHAGKHHCHCFKRVIIRRKT